MSNDAKNQFILKGGVILSIVLPVFLFVIMVVSTTHAQNTGIDRMLDAQSINRILDAQEHALISTQEQMAWLKLGCGGIITALCTVIAILFRTTQKQQSIIVHEIKNSMKIKEEILTKFSEIHEENLRNSQLNRDESSKKRDVLNMLTDAINSLPCITGNVRPPIAHIQDCPAR